MSTTSSSSANGPLWGWAARDWAEIQEQFARPVYQAAFERVLTPGLRYLDAGCGAGLAAQMAAERGAQVWGLDASENLLAIARERVPAGEFRGGELEALPYPDDFFDVVTGFNSFQFAANPTRALAEARRVARPGARVVIVTWGDPEGMPATALVTCLKELMPPQPAGAPGPFALSDEAKLRDLAAAAGLTPEEAFDTPVPWSYKDLATALRGLTSTGVAAVAVAHAGRAEVEAAYTRALEPFRRSDGGYEIGATFRCWITRA